MANYTNVINEDVYCEQVVFTGRTITSIIENVQLTTTLYTTQSNQVVEELTTQSDILVKPFAILQDSLSVQDDTTQVRNTATTITDFLTIYSSFAIPPETISESLIVSETAHTPTAITVRETLRIDERISTPTETILSELLYVQSNFVGSSRNTETDSAVTNSALFTNTRGLLTETVHTAARLVTPSVVASVTEILRVADSAYTPTSVTTAETVSVSTNIFAENTALDLVKESFTAFSTVIQSNVITDTVLEHPIIADTLVNGTVHGTTTTYETIWVYDDITGSYEVENTTAWVANLDTFAMSRYTGHEQHSASIDVVVGPEGVFTTGDESFTVQVVDGLRDFGNKHIKRMPYAYVGTSGVAAEVMVHETDTGELSDWRYPVEERQADAARPSRAKLGRGLRSRYVQFGISGLAGLHIYDFSIDIAESNRRI